MPWLVFSIEAWNEDFEHWVPTPGGEILAYLIAAAGQAQSEGKKIASAF